MDNRNTSRKKVHINTVIFLNGKRHESIAENLSDNGLCITTSPTTSAIDFIPGSFPEVQFSTDSGESIDLKCQVRWLHSFMMPTSSVVNTLGMQIMTTNQEYVAYFEALQ